MATLLYHSRRDMWSPLFLQQGYSTAFHTPCSAQAAKQLYHSSSETTWIHLQLCYILRCLFFIFTTRKYTPLWKDITSRNNLFLHKKDMISPRFFFIGQCWFIHFLYPAHIHVIKKNSSRCTDIWSSMSSCKNSWVFLGFEEKMKSWSRESREVGFMYFLLTDLLELG